MRALMGLNATNKASLAIDCEKSIKILTDFIRTEVQKAGFAKAVVGLSGGIDSSLSATLAVLALGKQNVIGVMMPFETSSSESLSDTRQLVSKLNIPHHLVEITPMVKPYLEMYPEMDSIRRGNVMARMRMIVLYDISAAEKALVLGTANKTEYLLGYTTLWGDMACALNPLGDLYKTQVRTLAKYLDLPGSIINKKPSADLWAGQTDEEELGFSYEEADNLLELLIDRRLPPEEVEALGYSRQLIDNIMRRVHQTQYKRHLPLIAKLSHRSVNRDFQVSGDRDH
jgi:NAD+ synthase